MRRQQQLFGGDWTTEKLKRVQRYLAAYAKIMSKQKLRFAFAACQLSQQSALSTLFRFSKSKWNENRNQNRSRHSEKVKAWLLNHQ